MTVSDTLIERLGEELIKNNGIGVAELIKNSYDADATRVEVHLGGAFGDTPDESVIVIKDNGFGMSESDLADKFFKIATGHKKVNPRTPKGRWMLGKKGIGRFALQRLGRELTIFTKKEGHEEWKVEVDWDKFDAGKDVGETRMSGTTEHPTKMIESGTGTLLLVRNLREKFDGSSMQHVKRAVKTMISPFSGLKDFDIKFKVPPEYASHDFMDIDTETEAKKAHFTFRALLDGSGTIDWEYSCNHPWSPNKGKVESGHWQARNLIGREPNLTNITYNFYIFQRVAGLLKKTGITRKTLDQIVGVRLYRDGLRVWPYGDMISDSEIDDWLNLSSSRLQDNSKWVGHEQVIGAIEFNQESNPELEDKTDRTGLQDNDQYKDLHRMSREIISKMTTDLINLDKRNRPPPSPTPPPPPTLVEYDESEEGSLQPEIPPQNPPRQIPNFPTAPEPATPMTDRIAGLPKNIAEARQNVKEASAALSRVISTLHLDSDSIIDSISDAEESLAKAKKVLEE